MPEQSPVRLEGKGRSPRVIDACNRARDMMRNDNDNARRDQTGRVATHPVAAPPVDTAEQQETVRRGLRVLAKIIARAHLRRQSAQWEVIRIGREWKMPPSGTPRPAARRRGWRVSKPWNGG